MVLGRDVENMLVLSAMARLIVTRMQQIILNRPDKTTPDVEDLFVIDEAQTVGYQPFLREYCTNARSKGGAILMATQTKSSLVNVYGESETEEILGQFTYRGYLRMNDPTSRQFCSQSIGNGERFKIEKKKVLGGAFELWRETDELETVPIVPPEDFGRIPPPDPYTKTGVTGFFHGDDISYWHTLSSPEISKRLKPRDKSTPDFIPADNKMQHLKTWNAADLERLGLTHVNSPEAHHQHIREEGLYNITPNPSDETVQTDFEALLEKLRQEYEQFHADTDAWSGTGEDDDEGEDFTPEHRMDAPSEAIQPPFLHPDELDASDS